MKKNILICSLMAVLLLASCVSTGVDKESYNANQILLREGRTAEAVSGIEGQVEEYEDKVLYYLDLGVAKFYNGDYRGAIDALDEADRAIDEYGVASVTENAAALLANDYTVAYPGEKYEEVLVDVFQAISYQALGDSEGAMVEVRQAETALGDFRFNAEQQESGFEKFVLAITPDPFKYFQVPEVNDFTGSALADFMSMTMYRDKGDISNAEVDYRRLQNKGITVVSEADVNVPAGMARVNLLSFEGLIGEKVSMSAIASTLGTTHVVSWPWFQPRNSEIVSVTLSCSDGQSVTAAVLEDFNQLALETLAMDVKSKYLKSFYRGYTKVTATALAAKEVYDLAIENAQKARAAVPSDNPFAAMAADAAYKAAVSAAQLAYDEAIAAVNNTEIADTRMGQYLPARVSVAGLTVAPGVYDFTITYDIGGGFSMSRTYTGVEVKEGKANLLIGACAR